eukprot:COSAG01_NODE_4696_length_4806_cov_4.618016_5_plen_57_part_00
MPVQWLAVHARPMIMVLSEASRDGKNVSTEQFRSLIQASGTCDRFAACKCVFGKIE